MLMYMQKEIEVQQEECIGIPLTFAEFVRNVQHNVEKSLLSKRNRQIIRRKIKENWLLKSKILPPQPIKIGHTNTLNTPPLPLSPHSPHLSAQTCPVTQHDISPNTKKVSANNSKQKSMRLECKTSDDCLRKIGSQKHTKSSWKLQFRRDQLNILQYQRRSVQQLADVIESNKENKNFKLRRVYKKFQEIKHHSCQNYSSRAQPYQKKGSPFKASQKRIVGSCSVQKASVPL